MNETNVHTRQAAAERNSNRSGSYSQYDMTGGSPLVRKHGSAADLHDHHSAERSLPRDNSAQRSSGALRVHNQPKSGAFSPVNRISVRFD